jgi:hypothetical protein
MGSQVRQEYRDQLKANDPVRLRSVRYMAFVRSHPCLICGARADAHHIQYAQPRALGRKTGDQWTVPVCREHHTDLHISPMPEKTWWALQGVDPMIWAKNKYTKWSEGNGDD